MKSKTLVDVLVTLFGKSAVTLLQFVTTIALAYLLEPTDFGIVAMWMCTTLFPWRIFPDNVTGLIHGHHSPVRTLPPSGSDTSGIPQPVPHYTLRPPGSGTNPHR